MRTREEQLNDLSMTMYLLKDYNDKIAFIWALTNTKKINRRQFKRLLEEVYIPK